MKNKKQILKNKLGFKRINLEVVELYDSNLKDYNND
jgi:hypothetical protein